jgi:hypothetical protein
VLFRSIILRPDVEAHTDPSRVIGRRTTCDSDEHPYLRGYEVVVIAVLKNALRVEEYDYLTTEEAVRAAGGVGPHDRLEVAPIPPKEGLSFVTSDPRATDRRRRPPRSSSPTTTRSRPPPRGSSEPGEGSDRTFLDLAVSAATSVWHRASPRAPWVARLGSLLRSASHGTLVSDRRWQDADRSTRGIALEATFAGMAGDDAGRDRLGGGRGPRGSRGKCCRRLA